ncbi:flagellar basal-body MS-ring/collar protein FliF [Ramlibacter sp. PS3R-8]|uniref:flagellar basal-body MS-ring/collar protein FliF n=1 Tax=Ramlibacter sp. PS3R-8 TaxID=3133437 RepID=UPI0030A0CC02
MKAWWMTLNLQARRILLAGFLAAVVSLAAAAWWTLRVDYAVLFSDLRPQDAAVMAAELDKLKATYVLADAGATVMVDRAEVHTLRMKLMGRDLPLHGTVGLELFNNTDFGVTDFAQKINYQRALQGELTRTILSFPEIRDARVHLALPEQGLFKQNAARPKAALTLTVRAGQALRGEQVSGIQRLVAAAVPGLIAGEVTIVDQHGVALSRSSDAESDAGGSARLEWKRETENYLSRKATAVLDQAFGPGQALASVDVTLNMDHVRVTTEDVVPASDPRAGGVPAGVLVRERESARDNGTPDARATDARAGRGNSMQRDVEYQAGRRTEHVVSQAGAIRRIHVVALVRQPLGEQQRAEVHKLVAAAVGASVERGDTVVVQAVAAVSVAQQPAPPGFVAEAPSATGAPATFPAWMPGLLAFAGLAAAALAWRQRSSARTRVRQLTERERRATLAQVQSWMLESSPALADGVQPEAGAGR